METQAPGAVRTGTVTRWRGATLSGTVTTTSSLRAAGSTPTQVNPMARTGRWSAPTEALSVTK